MLFLQDTEAIDSILKNFLPSNQYFRFNPSIEPFAIDEIRCSFHKGHIFFSVKSVFVLHSYSMLLFWRYVFF